MLKVYSNIYQTDFKKTLNILKDLDYIKTDKLQLVYDDFKERITDNVNDSSKLKNSIYFDLVSVINHYNDTKMDPKVIRATRTRKLK